MLIENDKNISREETSVSEWLNLQVESSGKEELDDSDFFYIRIIKQGLATKSVDSFIKRSNLTKKQLSRIIHVSSRTLQRNGPESKLSITSSEKLVELTRLYLRGTEIFGDREKFNLWLDRPNRSLADKKPIELLETNIGIEMVFDELLRIEYGIFS